MKGKPILFTGENVRAILRGRKTQTRRVIKPQPPEWTTQVLCNFILGWSAYDDAAPDGAREAIQGREIVPGDLLWVRETWMKKTTPDRRYRADHPTLVTTASWTPSIHMPRWASRLTLRVSHVRVERLHVISHDDCIAEGCEHFGDSGRPAVSNFWHLWDFINAKRGYSWESNPWVWIIEWDKVWQQNIDEVTA